MYKEKIINLETQEETLRDYTSEEIKEAEVLKKQFDAQNKEIAAKETLRQSAFAKLIDLGLTEDEIAAL